MKRPSCFGGRWPATVCLVLLIVSSLAYGEPDSSQSDKLGQLRSYLGAMQDLRAEFRQEVLGVEKEVLESASGTVILSKPGRFRWDYQTPYERVIVADGERVWFYEADLEQVTIRRMTAGLGDTPAALLTGDEAALEEFEFVSAWADADIQWLQLAPVSLEADFSTVDLGFVGSELQRIEFLDRLGQRTRLLLSGIDHSPQLAEGEFQFKIPAGVDVIGEDDM